MLSRTHRFHGHNSLNYVYKSGHTARTADISLRYAPNNRRETYRCAVVVSKKVSKSAVVRNRIRRRVYEAVRLQEARITEPLDLVFSVFQEKVAVIPSNELQQRVKQLLDQAVEPRAKSAPVAKN